MITPFQARQLEDELLHRKEELRPLLAQKLQEAIELGDIPENSPYDAASKDHTRNEVRINEIEELLNSGIDEDKSDVGKVYRLQKEDGIELELQLVDSITTSSPNIRQVTSSSPLGNQLKKAISGDIITYNTPSGINITYTVLDIR